MIDDDQRAAHTVAAVALRMAVALLEHSEERYIGAISEFLTTGDIGDHLALTRAITGSWVELLAHGFDDPVGLLTAALNDHLAALRSP